MRREGSRGRAAALAQRFLAWCADARVVVAAVIWILVTAWITVSRVGAPVSVRAILRAVPEGFDAIVVEPMQPSRARTLVTKLLGIPEASLPNGVRPVATMLLQTATSERLVTVVPTAVARRAGLAGLAAGNLTVIGLPSDGAGSAGTHPPLDLPRSLLKFLGQSTNLDVRLLLRTSWLERRFPALELPTSIPDEIGLAVEDHGDSVRLRGLLSDRRRVLHLPSPLLRDQPAGTLALVDGVFASALLPPELPPVLDAIVTSTGVEREFAELRDALGDAPAFLLIRAGVHHLPDIVLGFARPASGGGDLNALVRNLLRKRQGAVSAELAQLRVEGKRIRHYRPRRAESVPLEELPEGPWRILEVLRRDKRPELSAALGPEVILVGTSADAVREAAQTVAPGRQGTQGRGTRLFVDGALLRQQPVYSLVPRELSPRWRAWAQELDTVLVDSREVRGTIEFSVTVNLAGDGSQLLPLSVGGV